MGGGELPTNLAVSVTEGFLEEMTSDRTWEQWRGQCGGGETHKAEGTVCGQALR